MQKPCPSDISANSLINQDAAISTMAICHSHLNIAWQNAMKKSALAGRH
jgi:hypothetical protein